MTQRGTAAVALFGACEPFGPTRGELEAIEAEWPLIAAEIALVDTETHAALHPGELTDIAVEAARAAVATARRALVPDSGSPIHQLPVPDLKEVS